MILGRRYSSASAASASHGCFEARQPHGLGNRRFDSDLEGHCQIEGCKGISDANTNGEMQNVDPGHNARVEGRNEGLLDGQADRQLKGGGMKNRRSGSRPHLLGLAVFTLQVQRVRLGGLILVAPVSGVPSRRGREVLRPRGFVNIKNQQGGRRGVVASLLRHQLLVPVAEVGEVWDRTGAVERVRGNLAGYTSNLGKMCIGRDGLELQTPAPSC